MCGAARRRTFIHPSIISGRSNSPDPPGPPGLPGLPAPSLGDLNSTVEAVALVVCVLGLVPCFLRLRNGNACEALLLFVCFLAPASYHATLDVSVPDGVRVGLEVTDSATSICLVVYCALDLTLTTATLARVVCIAALIGASCGYTISARMLPPSMREHAPPDLTLIAAAACVGLIVAARMTSGARVNTSVFTALFVEGAVLVGAAWMQWSDNISEGTSHAGWHACLLVCTTLVALARNTRDRASRKRLFLPLPAVAAGR